LFIRDFLRSDFRQTGRESCSSQQHLKLAKTVVSFDFEISKTTLAVIESKEMDMKNSRSNRSTSVTSNNLVVSFKAELIALFAAASLVMMSGVGDHSS
jgi:hypothetical protein